MKIQNVKLVEYQDWNALVEDTYGKPYDLQQQNGCMERGTINMTVPEESYDDDMPETISEDGEEMGVKFASWLARDPKQPFMEQNFDRNLEMWWDRNFYPELQAVANDLYNRGLLEAGNYIINIDW